MSQATEKNEKAEKVLMELVEVLEDGQKGFAEIGEHLKSEQLKRYFFAESLRRAEFRGELENELHRQGMADVKESGSVAGALHRTWADLKSKLGGGDHALLESAEQGEDEAKKKYKEALEQDLPLDLREIVATQQAHILTSHDYVKRHRDALKS